MTNEQRETALILQMKADLDEARGLLTAAREAIDSVRAVEMTVVAGGHELGPLSHDMCDFLARTEPKHGGTK